MARKAAAYSWRDTGSAWLVGVCALAVDTSNTTIDSVVPSNKTVAVFNARRPITRTLAIRLLHEFIMPPTIVRKVLIFLGRAARGRDFSPLSRIAARSRAGSCLELLEFAGFSIGHILQPLESAQHHGFASPANPTSPRAL